MKVIRRKLLSWALRRQGPDALPLHLTPRRIYILPTPTGWVFFLLVFAMFLAGMNYGNGLALLLTFWLASFALVAMIQTQRGLAGLTVLRAHAEPAFAGGEVAMKLQLESRLAGADLLFSAEGTTPASAPSSGAAGVEASGITLKFSVKRRGPWQAPVLRLSTTAPYGLFRTWAWLALDVRSLVYPKPEGNLPLPEVAGSDTGERQIAGSLDELSGLRPFRDGDSPRQVAWKAYARGAPLLVREYHGQSAARREFDFDALPGLGLEAKLSQLALWVVAAATQKQYWSLRLPGAGELSGAGNEHLHACLARLALFESGSTP